MSQYTADECFAGMLKADEALYERYLDTPGFALWWNRLGLRAKLADELLAIIAEMLPDWSYMRSGENPENTEWRDDLDRRASAAIAKAKGT